ncbi:gliotoxin biosynthesis protein GliK [Colletotrichum graminicola M1.001]|uniref:gamma-glutamylcyclotransferase n=1 Tax=Colletotrichum graminicola (strain M1.001 / M2 / FGSC 10212) TaxID=645133 RepID=E3QZQ5_COLGM|nr:gliotoxin biosynthesis protein GliK [Colletotrichum graminicola M1.001]EFQ36343.1 gliotoxin biosynthesis protein GliK [Colletotrichum graminicola M1.001]
MTTPLPQEPVCLVQRIRELATATPPPAYPPISSIPRTPPTRLAAASSIDDAAQGTVLYLAYGSNLSAETFLGARGIRPVSQVNVSAPALTLVFDLPGLPYREPCFANTAPRKVPNLPDPSDPPKFPPIPPPPPQPLAFPIAPGSSGRSGGGGDKTRTPDLGWDKGLFGVVYEVTREDYATIVATEGGGSSYADIMTPCIPLPPRVSVPEKPPIDIPRPFFAHTLYSPAIPGPGDEDDDDKSGEKNGDPGREKPDDPRKKWYWRFIRPVRRPDPTYAQPSARYLKLITDGAAEHKLPDDYQRWLRSLRPYVATTLRQRLARWLLTAVFWVPVLLLFVLSKALANKEGRAPLWIGVALGVVFNLLWMAYDGVLKPVFGDGERTQDEDEDELRGAASWRASCTHCARFLTRRRWGYWTTWIDSSRNGVAHGIYNTHFSFSLVQ